MKKRIISAVIMLLIVIPLIILGGIPFALAVGVIGIGAYKELIDLRTEKRNYPKFIKLIGLLCVIFLIYSNFEKLGLLFGVSYKVLCGVILALAIPIIFYFKKYNVDDFFHMLSNVLFLGIGFNLIISIYNYDLKYFILLILITILTDTFALFGGMLIGKHKFTKISPNKTIEGCIVGSIVSTFVCSMYYINLINANTNLFMVVLIILILSIIGQIGDLFFSAIKREYNKKDFSNLIPGHGGILDRLDSIIFVLFAFAVFMSYLWEDGIMITLIILIIMLGILIFVHEFGHFIVAKKCGVHVDEFALGMGPIIFKFRRKNDPTLYSIRLLPIGGFCAMAGEVIEESEKKLPKNKYMCNKKPYQRFLILVAGVTMNFILALVLLFLQGMIWGSSNQLSYVGLVTENAPISRAGIVEGDRIISINGVKTPTWDKIQVALALKNKGDSYDFVVKKEDGTTKKYEVTPEKTKNEDGEDMILFGFGAGDNLNKGIINSIKYAFIKFWSIISSMALIIGKLITGKLSLNSLAGPVGMYSVVGAAKTSFQNILYLTAYLSVNLGFVNVLPFPAFDGGRILFVIIEKIKGSPVKPEVENWFHTIGFILLMILMVVITYQDILRLFK